MAVQSEFPPKNQLKERTENRNENQVSEQRGSLMIRRVEQMRTDNRCQSLTRLGQERHQSEDKCRQRKGPSMKILIFIDQIRNDQIK